MAGSDVHDVLFGARDPATVALVEGTYRWPRVWAREGDGGWRVIGGQVAETR